MEKRGMNLPTKLLIAVSVALLTTAAPARADLIVNGGFETGDFTGWSLSLHSNNTSVVPGGHTGN
jgi:hypothetical protein